MTKRLPKRILVLVLLLVFIGTVLAARTCPNCGTENPDNARFCKNCGYKFPARRVSPARRSLPLIRARVSVETGVVRINSTPTGASVSIDGRRRGTTPLSVRDLTSGQHDLVLSKSGYRSYDGIFVIPKVQGTIVVTTVPSGAEILIDSKLAGVAGDAGLVVQDVAFGSHILLARLPGYDDEVKTVQLSSEQPVVLTTVAFQAGHGFLRVESDPQGAVLKLDGRQAGPTTYIGKLAPARYELLLIHPGFNDWEGEVEVLLKDTAFVFATLTPLRVRKPAFLWVGVATLAGGAAAAVMGQLAYSEYQDAAPPDYSPGDVEKLRKDTELYDWVRNIAGGIGVLSLGAYLVF